MRISKTQLRQIIKEELAHSMQEMGGMGMEGGMSAKPTPKDAFDAVMYMYEQDPDRGDPEMAPPAMHIEDIASALDVSDAEAFRLIYQAGGMARGGMTVRPNRMGTKVFIVPAR